MCRSGWKAAGTLSLSNRHKARLKVSCEVIRYAMDTHVLNAQIHSRNRNAQKDMTRLDSFYASGQLAGNDGR